MGMQELCNSGHSNASYCFQISNFMAYTINKTIWVFSGHKDEKVELFKFTAYA